MGLRIVNTVPGESTDPVKPRDFAQFGIKSELMKVPLASLSISMGLTNVAHHDLLPENDTTLTAMGAEVTLETSERRRPVDGTTSRAIVSDELIFTKNNTLDGELGIYEVKMPITERASCLAHFKFRTKLAWTAFAADWCNLSNMIGMYFGLEHGTFNTAAYMFLRGTVNGSLVVGGPLQSYNTARPAQVEVIPGAPHASTPGFEWKTLADGTVVDFFIFFNVEGYQAPPVTGVPTNVPLVEIWTKTPLDDGPVAQAYIPVGSLGTFPSSLLPVPFTNSRPGTSNTATIFFGNIARTGGSDVLELIDWEFYPDYRLAVHDGIERPKHNLIARPDAPMSYAASMNDLPTELEMSRWFEETGAGWISSDPSLFYQAGRRGQALYLVVPKTENGLTALHRTEPRFEERVDGIMVEAYISGEILDPDGDGTGMGFSVEDGDKLFQVMAVDNPQRSFYAIAKDLLNLDSAADGYHAPSSDADVRTPKLVRLVVDRLRPAGLGGGKALLVVDEETVVTTDLSTDTFPASSSSTGFIRFGHLGLPNAKSSLRLGSITYLPRYLAWEGVDQLTPDDAGINSRVLFTLDADGLGSHSIVDNAVEISKGGLGGMTKRQFTKNQPFAEVDGQVIDFKMSIVSMQDFGGETFPKNTASGVALTVFLGNKKVEIGFYDCGTYGRHVAILPTSGLESDIIEQTEIGRMYSAPLDWTRPNIFRLVIKGREELSLRVGSVLSPPVISVDWQDDTLGFDLPEDVSTPRLVFGHKESQTSSVSRWDYIRWGLSDGFEIAVQQEYPDGYPKYLFGGRVMIKSEFEEA